MSIQQAIEDGQFYHVFQPIFEINKWEKIGYEVLLRTHSHPNPELVFQEAKKEDKLFQLDSWSIQRAVMTFCSKGAQKDGYLFLNIFPSTVIHPDFPSFLTAVMKEKRRYCRQELLDFTTVFEMHETEIAGHSQFDLIKERIRFLKEQKILISVGKKEENSFRLLQEISPHFIKLDKCYSEDLFQSKQKQSYIDRILKHCDQYGCKLILEGIEKDVQLATAKYIGVQFTQGYLLGRPAGLEW